MNKSLLIGFFCLTLSASLMASEVHLPWGKRAGAISQKLSGLKEGQRYSGPTSVRLGPQGDLYVLDTLGAKVERYKTDGSFVASYSYPAASQYDEELVGIDFAFGPKGELYVLEEAMQAIFVFDVKGKFQGLRPIPSLANQPRQLMGLECDSQGRLYVVNGYDNSVTRFLLSGKDVQKAHSDIAAALTMDCEGTFWGLTFPKEDSFSVVDVVKSSAFAGRAAKKVLQMTFTESVCDVAVLGFDKKGQLYVEAAEGAIERPKVRRIYVFSPTGKELKRFVVPPKPRLLTMIRSRILLPDGTLFCVRVKKDGFVLQSFP